MSAVEFPKKSIFVCNGSKCGKFKEIRKYIKSEIKEKGLKGEIEVFKMECSDRCKNAPVLCLQPQNLWLSDVTLIEAKKIIENI